MPAPLHPDLSRMYDQYNRLIDDCEAGHISYEDALGTLEKLVVVDGSGAHWGVNDEGDFTRSFPGEQPVKSDPIAFVPPQLPARPTAAAPPWNNPDLVAPAPSRSGGFGGSAPVPAPFGGEEFGVPAGPTLPGMPGMPGVPGMPLQGGPGALGVPAGFGESAPEQRPARGEKPAKAPKAPKAPKAQKASRENPLAGVGAVVLDRLTMLKHAASEGRGRTIAIAVVCALVLLVAWNQTRSDAPAEEGIPAAEAPAAEGALPALPTDGGAAPAAPTAPTGDESTVVLTAVTSGEVETAKAVVADPGDEVTSRLAVAELAGYGAAGLQVAQGPAAVDGEGAVQEWKVMNGDQELLKTSVRYVRAGEAWKLAAWPDFQR